MKCFTKKQLEELRRQLAALGIKDTDFDDALTLTGDEYVAIVQDDVNRKIKIADLFSVYITEEILEHIYHGKSAYEIAVEHGFQGTEEEWLESLKAHAVPVDVVNNLTDGGTTKALSAEMGKYLKELIDAITQGGGGGGGTSVTIVDNLTDGGHDKALSAEMGKYLKELIDAISGSGSTYVLPPATPDALGGVKTGYPQNGKNYPVKLDQNNRAFVNVPWTDTGGGGDSGDYDQIPGYYELAFIAAEYGDTPALPPTTVPLDETSGWSHSAPDNASGSLVIWMANRFVDYAGSYNDWQGPWRISGPGGENGIDGDQYEYVYSRTTDESVAPQNVNSGTPSAESIARNITSVTQDDFVPNGWYDNASASTVTIDQTNRVQWMAFRVKEHTSANPAGTWSNFIGPIPWSVYGKSGADGDGVEYIYYPSTTRPVTDPSTWDPTTFAFQNTREYIASDSGWLDDPVDLYDSNNYGPGWKQWVCIRKKYADTSTSAPVWHRYSEPKLWNYYPMDGDAATGIYADLDNDTMAVSLDGNGMNYAFSEDSNAYLYNGSVPVASTVTISSVKSSTGTDYSSRGWATVSGNKVTVAIPQNTVNLSSTHILVTISLSGTVSGEAVSRNIVLTLVGIHFGADGTDGTDGVCYKLSVNSRTIRKTKNGSMIPGAITPECVKFTGNTAIQVYSATGLPSGFRMKYSIDDGPINDETPDSISTSGVEESIYIALYYNNNILVDQETIFVFEDGKDGRYVETIDEFYKLGNSSTTAPTGSWTSSSNTGGWSKNTTPDISNITAGTVKYLWNYEVVTFDDGTKQTSDKRLISVISEGKGISEINNYYLAYHTETPAQSLRGNTTTYTVNSAWATSPQDSAAAINKDNPYLLNFEEIVFNDGSKYWSLITVIDRYILTDVEYLKNIFPEVNNENAAILTGYLGVYDNDQNNDVIAMVNGSDLGKSTQHGKLLFSSGFTTDFDVNHGTDGTFKVYEDGYLYATNANIKGTITATSGTFTGTVHASAGEIGTFELTNDGWLLSDKTVNGHRYSLQLSETALGYHDYGGGSGYGSGSTDVSIGSNAYNTSNYSLIELFSENQVYDRGIGIRMPLSSSSAVEIDRGSIELHNGNIILDSGCKISGFATTLSSVTTTSSASSPKVITKQYHIYVNRANNVYELPSSPSAGDEYEIIARTGCSIVSSKTIYAVSGGQVGTAAAGSEQALVAGYAYRIIYDGTAWNLITSR